MRWLGEKKIYCKNCVWFTSYTGCEVGGNDNTHFTQKYLNRKGEISYKWKNQREYIKHCKDHNVRLDNFNGRLPVQILYCNFNEKYNCKYYKRLWWKFWIR